jgi:diguanylate cyclase (GGDEF)-like protein/PAS domain S-box-containing protein
VIKREHKIIIITIIIAMSYWISDAFVAYRMQYDESFLNVLFTNPKENPVRLFVFSIIIASGLFVTRVFSQRKPAGGEIKISEAYYRQLFEKARDGILMLDAGTGQIENVNQSLIDMLGYSRGDLLGNKLWEIGFFKDIETGKDAFAELIRKKYILYEHLPLRTKDDRIIDVEFVGNIYTINAGKVVQCTIRNITESRQAEENVIVHDDFIRGVLNSMTSHISIIDQQGRIIEINEAWKRFARENGPIDMKRVGIGVNYIEVCQNVKGTYAELAQKAAGGILNVLNGRVPVFSFEYPCPSETEERWFLMHVTPLEGKQSGAVVAHTNITELKEMEEKMHNLSITDSLTGLYNRRGFFSLAEKQIKVARRMNRTLLLFSVDLDGLKEINDKFGHQEGDLALVATANILMATYRESDIIARIGGDEFAIIQTGAVEGSIDVITARLKKNLEHHNAIGNRRFSLSMSFGTAWYYPENPRSIDELLAQADIMMYKQKRLKMKT